MQKIILEKLKTKYNYLGLSEAILKAYAEKGAKAVKEESEIDGVIETYEVDLKIHQSFSDQIRNLKKENEDLKIQIKEAKTQEPKGDDQEAGEASKKPKADDETPAWAKTLIENNNRLAQQFEQFKTEKVHQSNSEILVSKLKELGVSEQFYKGRLKTDFENEEQIIEFANSIKNDEEELLKSLNITKLQNQDAPKFGENISKDEVSAEAKAFIEAQKTKKDE